MLPIEMGLVPHVLRRGANQISLGLLCDVVMTTRRHLFDTRLDACSPHPGDETWSDGPKNRVLNIGLVRAMNRSHDAGQTSKSEIPAREVI